MNPIIVMCERGNWNELHFITENFSWTQDINEAWVIPFDECTEDLLKKYDERMNGRGKFFYAENKTQESTKVFTLPSSAEIMAFTQEMIENLPDINEVDLLPAGSFAKIQWGKAPSSLVFISINEAIDKGFGSMGHVNCNTFNGYVDNTGYAYSTSKRKYDFGGEYWLQHSLVPDTFDFLK